MARKPQSISRIRHLVFSEEPSAVYRCDGLAFATVYPGREAQVLETAFAGFVTLNSTSGNTTTEGSLRLAVHVHAFYPEFIEDIQHALAAVRYHLDLFVTTCTLADEQFIWNYLSQRELSFPIKVRLVENRGRDIGPMLTAFPEMWECYDIIAHVHSKKSLHTGFGELWRQYTLDQMFGSPNLVDCIMRYLEENNDVGFFYPDNLQVIKEHVHLAENAPIIKSLIKRAGLRNVEMPAVLEFAAGSMAWFRSSAFRTFVDSFATSEDFDLEEGQLDKTIAHAVERAFPIVAKAQGFRVVCYYPRRRTHLPPFDRRHPRIRGPQSAGKGWLRDDPQVAAKHRAQLQPLNNVYDARALDIHWVIPDFIRGAGGHMTIFRFVELLERFGHRQTIWIQNPVDSAAEAKSRMQSWYIPFKGKVFVNLLPDDTRQLAGDIIIATDRWTVYPVVSAPNFKERFYFIQDYEPYFYPVGENYLTTEQTYHMGLCGLCAGDWLLGKMQAIGVWAAKWDLAVDHEIYYPETLPQKDLTGDQKIRIAFYARGYTPRRARRLGIAAFEELHKRGLRFRVIMFGETLTGESFAFDCEERGIVSPQQLASIYRESDIGVVFSTTNYSLIPLEMMACDLPVVEIDTESTRAVFRNGEVSLAIPDPRKIADAIRTLLNDTDHREEQRANGRNFVAGLSWETSVRAVEKAILSRLDERGFRVIVPEIVCAPIVHHRPSASIFIPTFNAGPRFKAILERLTQQEAPFKYENSHY